VTRRLPLPSRLLAPPPGWTTDTDVVVVGSGIAGLTVALGARAEGLRVLLVTKALLEAGSTRWAQGGIAAALGPGDTPDQHLHDTLVAGVGLCDVEAVRTLVTEGPGAVRRLIALGAAFDRDPDGTLALTREGGHLRNRIAHAGGDATGAEVSRALAAAVVADPDIEVIEHALVLDLLHDAEIAVVLATPTASPPAWLHQAHPETLPIDANGNHMPQGTRLGEHLRRPAPVRGSTVADVLVALLHDDEAGLGTKVRSEAAQRLAARRPGARPRPGTRAPAGGGRRLRAERPQGRWESVPWSRPR